MGTWRRRLDTSALGRFVGWPSLHLGFAIPTRTLRSRRRYRRSAFCLRLTEILGVPYHSLFTLALLGVWMSSESGRSAPIGPLYSLRV